MAVRSTSGHSRESGFTLIEVLAALAITSVIIMSTAALMWNVTLFFDHGARSVSEADRLVLAEDRLAADFSATRFAQRLTASGGATAAFIGQPAKVLFVSGDVVSTSPQEEEVVALNVEHSEDITQLVRRRAAWLGPRTQLEGIVAKDPVVLIEGRIDVRFKFAKVALDGTLSWQDYWSDELTLPRFVQMIVRSRETGTDLLSGAEFVVRTNSPPSCVTEDASAACLVPAAAQSNGSQPHGDTE
jgi:prepilin-type N-terminal cleavage/methylation domain-containing protein